MIAGIVLCAGFGTRLKPITLRVPKPAIPFLGRPLVWYALHQMRAAHIDTFAANVHWLPDEMVASLNACADALSLSSLSIFREQGDILGTAGGARACAALLPHADTFVIYHGDVLCSADISDALRAHQNTAADVTLVVAPRTPNMTLGMVGLSGNQIVKIRDWTASSINAPIEPCCFTGIHIVSRAVLNRVASKGYACLVTEIYPKMFREGTPIYAYKHNGFFADVGTPQTYLNAQKLILDDPSRLPGAQIICQPASNLDTTAPVFIEPTVKIGKHCALGPNACVCGNTVIEDNEKLSNCMRFNGGTIQ